MEIVLFSNDAALNQRIVTEVNWGVKSKGESMKQQASYADFIGFDIHINRGLPSNTVINPNYNCEMNFAIKFTSRSTTGNAPNVL